MPTIDGVATDWIPDWRLDSSLTGTSGYGIFGTADENNFYFAITSDAPLLDPGEASGNVIGTGTTVWLDTDLDRTTGYQIWGFAGGAEYNVEVTAGGDVQLFSGGPGETLVATLTSATSADGTFLEFSIPKSLLAGNPARMRVFADVNNVAYLPNDYANSNFIVGASTPPVTVGAITLDGDLADWLPGTQLDSPATGTAGYAIHGDVQDDSYVFAISASPVDIGTGTTIWLDTDLDRTTGYQIWGFTGGAEYNIEIGADGAARLYTGGAGETFVADLDYAVSTDGNGFEVAVAKSLLEGDPSQVRVFADVNNAAFLPNDYANVNLVVRSQTPPVTVGAITLDGDLSEWLPGTQLDTPTTGAAGYAIHGDVQDDSYVFAISADTGGIGSATTIWLDTDLNRATGHQIWGVTGGAEYNINIGADGVAKLYTGGAGETFVADLDHAINASGSGFEVAVAKSLLAGDPSQVRVFADINDTVFLPNDYASVNLLVGAGPAPVTVGAITLDGDLADWLPETQLDSPATGAAGYTIHGDVQDESYVFAISASPVDIGNGTTIWLDTDLDRATGHQIWGVTGGAEYNIEIGTDGTAGLYTGGAGETFVADLDFAISADGSGYEVAVAKSLLAGDPSQVRVFADVNNAAFLPNDYANVNFVVSSPVQVVDDPELRVGIVFSETTAANFYSETAYSQLFMSVQNQARMAGVPYDLLTESDLIDPANLAGYDALIFPGFSHVQTGQLNAIENSLATASAQYGIGLIAAGNFLTNDQTGAALAGNSYARMQSLLGVTLDGFGQTDGLTLEAGGGTNPILDTYSDGQLVGEYSNNSYLHFSDTTGTGEVLFDQIVATGTEPAQSLAAVIATQTAANNVHFATDAIIGNNNILSEAIDWVLSDTAPDVSLLMTRGSSLFYSRNDMDLSSETYEVLDLSPGVYDLMIPIVENWYETYGFVGSYYINIGANPPDTTTDWSYSAPIYQALMAMENEIGSHSYTHPNDTNLLSPDTQQILDLVALVDPSNPNAVDPWTLSPAERDILEGSFRFQFETARKVIEQQLGIVAAGAAVPGAPEYLETTREIIQYYDYLSGGYASIGSGFPGAFGYLTPAEDTKVYLAPNMSFDFSLIQFQGLTPEEALAQWLAEYDEITSHATTPILAFPWHDYGPTNLSEGYDYPLKMFEAVIAQAHADGTEFVTGQQLANRIEAFAASDLVVERNGDVVTATVTSADAGHFALNMGDEGTIASVDGWYAWNDTDVLLPTNGGTFVVNLGVAQDVTHVTDLPNRAELISVTGDGSNLSFTFEGRGDTLVSLRDQGSDIVQVTGVDGASFAGTDQLTLTTDAVAAHTVDIDYIAPGQAVIGSAEADVLLGGDANDFLYGWSGNDTIRGGDGSDLLFGSTGDDVIAGGEGDDVLRGGEGADTFIFETLGGNDGIVGFTTGLDMLTFVGLGFASAADAYGAFVSTSEGLELDLGLDGSVVLAGLDQTGLAATDINIIDVLV